MIGIRSITYQLPPNDVRVYIPQITKLSRMWEDNFSNIKTQRVSFCPFMTPADGTAFRAVSDLCSMSSVRWFNVPINPHQSRDVSGLFEFALNTLKENSRAFVNVLGVVNQNAGVDTLCRCAGLIQKTAALDMNGKDNFRLGISMNVQADGPFFPFTYSSGSFGFSIALELTQEINEICVRYKNLDLASLRVKILTEIVPQVERLISMPCGFNMKPAVNSTVLTFL